MSRAAIYWNPEAYDTSGKALMGRHSAGEGFMRGYIRHGAAEQLTLWNIVNKPAAELEPLVRRLEPSEKPIDWIARGDQSGLRRVGVVNLPVPGLARYAWGRRVGDQRAYSLCGVTHTTVTGRVLDALNELAIAPVQPWDALVCTSRAVIASLKVQSEMLDEYLKERLGAQRAPRPQYAHIPLGINTSDFETKQEDRKRWREQLTIEDDDIAVLYVGRFNLTSKMNPVPMAMALERAAVRSGKRVHWVLAGWADERLEVAFREAILAHCLNVTCHFVDGRPPENRFSIWAVGDIFLSLSDNVQETFGLTPVEAMAAGLPSVISDWDGYKDLIRHGVDGFRISTYTPAAGLGRDLAFVHSQEWTTYDGFVGSISQFTAIDIDETARALAELMSNADLRRRMGASALERARTMFDWKAIIPRYEALWAELNARRRAAPAEAPRSRNNDDNPWRPDPFRMFAGYPTESLTGTTMLAPVAGMSWEAAQALMALPVVRAAGGLLPQPAEVEQVLAFLVQRRQATIEAVLVQFPAPRRPHMERGLVWMAKYGLVSILGRSNHIPI
jgi:glycosyltransferase involved in cell wall biosynthesis